MVDLTDQLRILKDGLTNADGRIEELFSSSEVGVCLIGPDGRFERVNPAWENCLGHAIGSLLGNAFLDFVHPDDRARDRVGDGEPRERGERPFPKPISAERRKLQDAAMGRSADGGRRWIVRSGAGDDGRGDNSGATRDFTTGALGGVGRTWRFARGALSQGRGDFAGLR